MISEAAAVNGARGLERRELTEEVSTAAFSVKESRREGYFGGERGKTRARVFG